MTKNEKLLLLLLAIIVVLYLCKTYKNENFSSDILEESIKNYIATKYNDGKSTPTKFNMDHYTFTHLKKPIPLIMSKIEKNNGTFLNYLLVDNKCLYFLEYQIFPENNGVSTLIVTYGIDTLNITYVNDNFIFVDNSGKEKLKINKNLFIDLNDKLHFNTLNINKNIMKNYPDMLPNILNGTNESNIYTHNIYAYSNCIWNKIEKKMDENRKKISPFAYLNKNENYDSHISVINQIENEINNNYNIYLKNKNNETYKIFFNNTNMLFYKLIYYNILNKLSNNYSITTIDYSNYTMIDNKNNKKYNVFLAPGPFPQYMGHFTNDTRGQYSIYVNFGTSGILYNQIKYIANDIQRNFQKILDTLYVTKLYFDVV